ncbi:hypothetical protein AgCh_031565 [Apium graveolens]
MYTDISTENVMLPGTRRLSKGELGLSEMKLVCASDAIIFLGSFLSAAVPGLQAKEFSNAISCPSLHFIVACLPSSVLLQFFNEFGIFVMYSCGLMARGSSNEDSVGFVK